jgi:oligopeptide transport system substrate-binding protein
MWKKLGVNVELINTERQVANANTRQGDFEIVSRGFAIDYNDAQDFLLEWQTSSSRYRSRFSNPDYDRLMDEASVTNDPGKRAQLLQQAEQVLLREMPLVPLFFLVSKNLVSTRVKGWEDNLLDITYIKNLSLEK